MGSGRAGAHGAGTAHLPGGTAWLPRLHAACVGGSVSSPGAGEQSRACFVHVCPCTLRRGDAVKRKSRTHQLSACVAGEQRRLPGTHGHAGSRCLCVRGHRPATAVSAPWPPSCTGHFRPVVTNPHQLTLPRGGRRREGGRMRDAQGRAADGLMDCGPINFRRPSLQVRQSQGNLHY